MGRKLNWTLSPGEALLRWPADRPLAMLHSGRLDERWSRWTILAEPVGAWRFEERRPAVVARQVTGTPTGRSTWIGNPADAPARWWSHQPIADLRRTLAWPGLWVGYLGYDLGRWLEKLPSGTAADRGWPVAQLQLCRGWLVYDGVTGAWRACGEWEAGPGAPDLPAQPAADGAPFEAASPRPQVSREAFEAAVSRAIDYIAAGDAFQVNLAQRFTAPCSGEPRTLYQRLAQASPAWYGGYIELLRAGEAEPRRALASASPELFLQLDSAGSVVTRPIKGTRPASVDPAVLQDSAKDAAELAMIVDLLRNDLGRVAEYGSVVVEREREIESPPTVHHGVATIRATLRPGADLADLIAAAFPGGSITGAPKVRAMQIIDELEPVRRGPYCGAIGYAWRRPEADAALQAALNIAIRTLLVERDPIGDTGRVDFSVGGGIVGDSTPAGEYQETLDKAAALIAALRT